MTTPRRAQRAPRPVLVERPERFADARAAGPVVDRIGDAGQRPIAVAVAQQARHAGEPRPEHERLRADLGRGRERLDEPQQQPRVALHRARDVAQDDERARLADLAPPDPRHELAAGPEVAPEHRPGRQPAAVRVELVAARPAALEARHQQVHQPLRLAQLGRGHPVELAVAQDLALRVGVGRDDDALDRRFVVGVLVRSARDRACRARPGRSSARCSTGLRRRRRRDLLLVGGRPRRGAAVDGGKSLRTRVRAAATSGRTRRRRSAGRRGGGRRWRRRPRGPARGRRCRPGSAPGRSRPRRRGRSAVAPRGATARTRPPRRAGGGRRPRGRTAPGRWRDRARSSDVAPQPPAAASAR